MRARTENERHRPCAGGWLRRSVVALVCTGVLMHGHTSAVRAQNFSCRGDCNGDGEVTIDELITAINIALGTAVESACPALSECSGVDVACIVGAVNNALNNCPAHAATPSATPSPTAPTPTNTTAATNTTAPTNTPIPTVTATAPPSLTPTASATITSTPTVSPTRTATSAPGPFLTFFGLATAGGQVIPISDMDPQGIPIYFRRGGSGFLIVVESKPGSSGSPPGVKTLNSDPTDPSARPDLQIEANQKLGNGSSQVCDAGPRPLLIGGVPAINPPSFDPASQMIADALNDFGCRFAPHTGSDPCTIDDNENYAFAGKGTTNQMCSSPVFGAETALPSGDTLLTMQWRDTAGNVSPPKQIIVRVCPESCS